MDGWFSLHDQQGSTNTTRILFMKKKNLKTLIHDLEIAVAELKSEVYSDTAAYRISSDTDKHTTYRDINDEDGICD